MIHTHGALIRHLDNLNQIRRYTPDEVLFSNSPFFWIGGLAYSLLGTLVAGGRLVCSNSPRCGRRARRPRARAADDWSTASPSPSPISRATRASRDATCPRSGAGTSTRSCRTTSGRRDPDLRHAMLGMTETGSVCLVSDDESDQPEHRRGSFGRPAPGFEAVVVDPDTGAPCGPGEPGELCLRGPFLMEGYYGRERHEVFDADGWYRTGDFVVVDADGFFYFQGRRGDMIKTSGANVSPREVEAAIRDLAGLTAHVIGHRGRRARSGRGGGGPRAGRSRRATSTTLRSQLAAAALRLQGAAPVPAARRRRGSHAAERQARPARSRGAVRCRVTRGRFRGCWRAGARPIPSVQALVSDDRAITYAELDDASRALASRMVRAGLSKGDRVGLLMPNGIEWATVALAVMRVGAVLVPLSTLLRPPELLAQLRVASVSHLITVRSYRGRSYLDDLRSLAPALVESHRERAARSRAAGAPARSGRGASCRTRPRRGASSKRWRSVVRPADDMVILFTSGSRGAPKGVIHTHGSALRATAAGLEARCVGAGERLYIPMPFFWTGGFCGGLLSVLIAGATLLTESTPEPSRTIRFLERERVTLFRGWPDQAARIAAHPDFAAADLSSLRPGEPRSGPAAGSSVRGPGRARTSSA